MLSVNGKENIEEGSADEAWFILTNLNSLDESLNAYQKAHRLRRGFLGVKTEQAVRANKWCQFERVFSNHESEIRYIREIIFGKISTRTYC